MAIGGNWLIGVPGFQNLDNSRNTSHLSVPGNEYTQPYGPMAGLVNYIVTHRFCILPQIVYTTGPAYAVSAAVVMVSAKAVA